MLLWLGLLLWSGACGANQMYGAGHGTYCSNPESSDSDITAIRVFIGPAGFIKGVAVKQGSGWSEVCGKKAGKAQEFVLWPGEHITSVYGTFKVFFRHLVFHTDQGRSAVFGKEDGCSFTATPDRPGKVLTGVFGKHGLLGLSGMGFTWNYPLTEPQPPSPNPALEATNGTDSG